MYGGAIDVGGDSVAFGIVEGVSSCFRSRRAFRIWEEAVKVTALKTLS